MIYGSVCSGIEAASVAWHPLGWRAAWLAEIEAFPAAVLAHHYPDVPNLGDMTKLPKLVLTGKAAAPDVLVGGTPCQAFSVAGMREGLNDPRGQLTIKFVELADAIDHVRAACGDDPAVIVWENVPGVLSDKGNAFGCFLGAISGEDCELQPAGGKWANAGCVFGPQRAVAWRILDAQYFGLAQRRRRVFVVASARAGFNPAQVLFEFGGLRRDTPPRRGKGPTVAALTANGVGTCGADDNQGQAGHLIPSAGCWWDGGQVSVAIAVRTAQTGSNGWGVNEETAYTLDRAQGQAVAMSVALRGREGGATAELGDEVQNCLRASGGGGDKAHVLAPVTFPIQEVGKRTGQSTTDKRAGIGIGAESDPMFTLQAGAQHGVAVTTEHPPCVAMAFQPGNLSRGAGSAPNSDIFPTLKADHGRGASDQSPHVMHEMAVRRLTPRECERLQGFPDDWTLVPVRGKPAADGPRYKALGNSMAVPVMRWIGERIQMVCDHEKQSHEVMA